VLKITYAIYCLPLVIMRRSHYPHLGLISTWQPTKHRSSSFNLTRMFSVSSASRSGQRLAAKLVMFDQLLSLKTTVPCILTIQVCVQLPTYADNMLAFACCSRWAPAVQQYTDIFCPPGRQQCREAAGLLLEQTDGQTQHHILCGQCQEKTSEQNYDVDIY